LNNHILTNNKRIHAFHALGEYMQMCPATLRQQIELASLQNSWFTPAYIQQAVQAIAANLTTDKLQAWLSPYTDAIEQVTPKTVGLILAGNIPLVGFHDILTALIAGFNVQIKLSSDDKQLIPHLLNKLIEIAPDFQSAIAYVDRLKDFDVIIATGSNNTARYFEYYFKQVPHLIRKNRNSVAIVHGHEEAADLQKLGHDLFDYFGLGCRNVSKIYFPEQYDFSRFFEAIEPFNEVIHHHKYHNNYDYNKSIYLVNGEQHLDNGFLLLKEDERLASPLAVVYYQTYQDLDDLLHTLEEQKDHIQCVVSNQALQTTLPYFPLGHSQQPALDDYADGVNTLDFLIQNKSCFKQKRSYP